jgi:hypothetical protein
MPSGFHHFKSMTHGSAAVFKERGAVPRFSLSAASMLLARRPHRNPLGLTRPLEG